MIQPHIFTINGKPLAIQRTFMKVRELISSAGLDPATHSLARVTGQPDDTHLDLCAYLDPDELLIIDSGMVFVIVPKVDFP